MPEIRKKYDREFRDGAVRIVEETGKPIAQVARPAARGFQAARYERVLIK
jgi:hypothetical protein